MAGEITLERGALGEVELFVVSGDLQMGTTEPLTRAVDEAIDRGATRLLFDFTALDFLDSSVLRVLERARKRVDPTGGAVVVACARPVNRAFEITGLDRVFKVEPTREDALARFDA